MCSQGWGGLVRASPSTGLFVVARNILGGGAGSRGQAEAAAVGTTIWLFQGCTLQAGIGIRAFSGRPQLSRPTLLCGAHLPLQETVQRSQDTCSEPGAQTGLG